MKRMILALTLGCLAALPARAEDDRYSPVTNAATKKECGSCHMAFQPAFLPARSWKAIMADLGNHFGEDASLDPATAKEIEAYLVKNAGDASWFGSSRMLRGVASDWTPLRITELPRWRREHDEEIPSYVWKRKEIGSKANCIACHRGADRGYYEDD